MRVRRWGLIASRDYFQIYLEEKDMLQKGGDWDKGSRLLRNTLKTDEGAFSIKSITSMQQIFRTD